MANYCSQCGTELPEDARFCPACGEAVGSAPSGSGPPRQRGGRRPVERKRGRRHQEGTAGGWLGPYARYVVGALAVTVVLLLYIGLQQRPGAGPATSMAPGGGSIQGQDFTATIQQLQQALLSNPNDLQVIVSLGNAYYDAGKVALEGGDQASGTQMVEQATMYYRRALQDMPENPEIRTDLGAAYDMLGRQQEAADEFMRVLEYNPDFQTALFNLGIVHRKMGDTEAAREWFRRTVDAGPETGFGRSAAEQLLTLPPDA